MDTGQGCEREPVPIRTPTVGTTRAAAPSAGATPAPFARNGGGHRSAGAADGSSAGGAAHRAKRGRQGARRPDTPWRAHAAQPFRTRHACVPVHRGKLKPAGTGSAARFWSRLVKIRAVLTVFGVIYPVSTSVGCCDGHHSGSDSTAVKQAARIDLHRALAGHRTTSRNCRRALAS